MIAAVLALSLLHMIPRMLDRSYNVITFGEPSSQPHQPIKPFILTDLDFEEADKVHHCYVGFETIREYFGINNYFFVFFW